MNPKTLTTTSNINLVTHHINNKLFRMASVEFPVTLFNFDYYFDCSVGQKVLFHQKTDEIKPSFRLRPFLVFCR